MNRTTTNRRLRRHQDWKTLSHKSITTNGNIAPLFPVTAYGVCLLPLCAYSYGIRSMPTTFKSVFAGVFPPSYRRPLTISHAVRNHTYRDWENRELKNSLNVPRVCARNCGRNPKRMTRPAPYCAETIAACSASWSSPISQPLCKIALSGY